MSKNELSRSRAVSDLEATPPVSHWRLARPEIGKEFIDDGEDWSLDLEHQSGISAKGLQSSIGAERELPAVHVASVLRALQFAEIPERDIEIVLETDEALVVSVDPLLLTVAIGNLTYSAIKCSRDGARVILRSRTTEQGVSIEVEDECGGLHSGEPAALFPAAVRAVHRGATGLPLGATARIAEAMRGSLVVDHEPGVGCTFALVLPVRSVG
jgi:signal transduction histidine kinase